jgi:predicted phage gp36 major capsid-like protein
MGTIARMAKTQQKDILSRVQDLGAEALQRLADVPGGSRLVDMANETRTRLDEMQKKLRGLDELEKRVARLERELAKQQPARKATTARKRTTSARKPATAKKPPAA